METTLPKLRERLPVPNSDIRTREDLEKTLEKADKSDTIEVTDEYWTKKKRSALKRYAKNQVK